MEELDTIGAHIRASRLVRGWSVRELADRSGLSKTFISAIENGTRALNRRADLHAIADALEVALSDLTGQTEQGRRTNVAAYATIPRLRVALMDSNLAEPPDVRVAPAELARANVDEVLALRSRCDWLELGRKLPVLLDQLTIGAAQEGPDRQQYLRMLVLCSRAAGDTAKDLGFLDLFYIASQRCLEAARALDEPEYLGFAEFVRSNALLSAKARTRSLAVATRAADQLQARAGAERHVAEMYGMLHLTAALGAAIANDPSGADAHLDEAAEFATRLGECAAAPTHMGMGFGPTNVGFWRMTIALELNNAPKAVEVARDLVPQQIGLTSRQAAFHADRGRALASTRGREREAIEAFKIAERLAPQRLHANPSVRDSVAVMLNRATARAGGRDLRGLAMRLGVAA